MASSSTRTRPAASPPSSTPARSAPPPFAPTWCGQPSSPTRRAVTPPAAPLYDFTRYDRLVEEAAAYGIRVQITLAGTAPAWATADHKVSNNGPNPVYYGQLAGAVAAHFNGRVRAISIWNEPNWHGLLTPERICRRTGGKKRCAKTSARRYRALYQAGLRRDQAGGARDAGVDRRDQPLREPPQAVDRAAGVDPPARVRRQGRQGLQGHAARRGLRPSPVRVRPLADAPAGTARTT